MNSARNRQNSDLPTTGISTPGSAEIGENDASRAVSENSVLSEIVRASGLDIQHAPDQQLLHAEFLKIAARYKDIEFSVNPIVTALVHAALGKLSGIDDTTVARLEQFVANSLCENRETHARICRFWHSLVKIVSESER